MRVYLNLGFKNHFFFHIIVLFFFFSKPMCLRVTIEFWRNFRKMCFLVKNAFFPKKFENMFFGSNCSSFFLRLNAENRTNIRDTCFQTFSVCDLCGSDP